MVLGNTGFQGYITEHRLLIIICAAHLPNLSLESYSTPKGYTEHPLHSAKNNEFFNSLLDQATNDIILLGQVKSSQPVLHLDDFVVTLRNVWGKYNALKHDVLFYTPPGCEIDPDPETVRRLHQLMQESPVSAEDVEMVLAKWQELWRQPQKVRVVGVPINIRFARVMVDADYLMKQIVAGSVTPDIDGLQSLMDMLLAQAKDELIKYGRTSTVSPSFARFWFFPGEYRFLSGGDVTLIKKCEVILLTEEEHLRIPGSEVVTGGAGTLEQEFAQNISKGFSQLSKIMPVYAELEGLFRFVALATIMKKGNALSGAGLDLDYFLTHFPIREIHVDLSLPGVSNVRTLEDQLEDSDHKITYLLAVGTFGGISIPFDLTPESLVKDKTGRILELKELVLDERPSLDALCWDLQPIRLGD